MRCSGLHSLIPHQHPSFLFFFFNDTATTEIYTLSLHDALPISKRKCHAQDTTERARWNAQHKSLRPWFEVEKPSDRKSTRLNSSHGYISYAVFCLKKKKSRINDQEIVT